MQSLLSTLIAHPWATALAVAGVAVLLLRLLRRGVCRRRGVAEQPYHCLTIRLPPELVGPQPSQVLPGNPNVPAIWRKGNRRGVVSKNR